MTDVAIDINALDWQKADGLIPAVVQDARTEAVLMLGFMNRAALEATLERQRVVFFSRTRGRLWEKGEVSGNWLGLVDASVDCDNDTLLLRVRPAGPSCHRGTITCFGSGSPPMSNGIGFLSHLERVIDARIAGGEKGSYTAKLHADGIGRMAQKVGEEGVEVALAGLSGSDAELVGEGADLVFHLTLLLRARGLSLDDIAAELVRRHKRG